MKNSTVVKTIITAVTTLTIGGIAYRSFRRKRKSFESEQEEDYSVVENDQVSDHSEEGVQSDQVEEAEPKQRVSYAQIVEEKMKRGDYRPVSPIFEETIELVLDKDLSFAKDFYHVETRVNDFNSSLHPIVRILPCDRFIGKGKKVRTKRLDILFPIPLAFYMKKNHLDMGLYYKATSGRTELPGDGIELNLDAFRTAFKRPKVDDENRFRESEGYIINRLFSSLSSDYDVKDLEVKREGYFKVAYLVLDPITQKYVRRHKYVNAMRSEAVKNLKNPWGALEEYLTEIYEKYSLFDPQSEEGTDVIDIPEDIVDPKFLDRPDSVIAKDETEILDVILAYRVSFYLSDDEYPELKGINEVDIANLLESLITEMEISEKYNDPDDKRFKYLEPWIIEERPRKKGELNVLNLVKVGEDEFELQSIPIEDRKTDLIVEDEVNKYYLEKEE